MFRKLAKLTAYNRRELQPRLSDPDFADEDGGGVMDMHDMIAEPIAEPIGIADQDPMELLQGLNDHHAALCVGMQYLAKISIAAPPSCHMPVAMAISSTGMELMQEALMSEGKLSPASMSRKVTHGVRTPMYLVWYELIRPPPH